MIATRSGKLLKVVTSNFRELVASMASKVKRKKIHHAGQNSNCVNSMSFWNDACEAAVSRTRQHKIIASNTSSAVVVSITHPLLRIILTFFHWQVCVFFACGIAAGTMSWRFRRGLRALSRPDSMVWSQYGMFAGTTCLGCFLGIFETLGYAQYNFLQNTARMGSATLSDSASRRMNGSAWNWFAMLYVVYCLSFGCFMVAKLFVLNRLVNLCRPTFHETLQSKTIILDRVFRVMVTIGLSLITCCGCAMAVYASRIAAQDFLYANALESGDFAALSGISASKSDAMVQLQISESIMFSCQVVLLTLIVAAFVVAGLLCNRLVRKILSDVDSSVSANRLPRARNVAAADIEQHISDIEHIQQAILDKAADLQRRVLGTVVVVFAAFILRSIFAALFAAGYAQNAAAPNRACGDCEQCQSINYLIGRWIYNTYEFHNAVSCLSPLALSVALWGMTDQRMRKLISSPSSSTESTKAVI